MSKPNFVFDILFDSDLKSFCVDKSLSPIDKKRVLGLANDFESGKWRSAKFHQFIWNNIAETALTKTERDALIDNPESLMISAAQNLRLTSGGDKGKGSEIAEIFLYGVMKHVYKALPVVPKIYYKQNVQDNAKGADSVHIVLDDSEAGFSIWFGEAKFYSDIQDVRFDLVVDSVRHALDDKKLKKENSIILGVKELKDYITEQETLEKIKRFLAADASLDDLKPLLHIPILLIYECEITAKANEYADKYKADIIEYQKDRAEAYFKRQISKLKDIFKYQEIHFHLILFPVPCKEKIVGTFLKRVAERKEAAEND